MAFDIPEILQPTLPSVDLIEVMADMFDFFTNTSAKFSVVSNGGSADAFTLEPDDPNESFHLNWRRVSSLTVQVSIDPLANITNPGTPASPPTMTDSSEWSGETLALQITGSELSKYALIVFKDAVCLLFGDSEGKMTERGTIAGRVIVPDFFDQTTKGLNWADGLGILGYTPRVSTSSGPNFWLGTTANLSIVRTGRQRWDDQPYMLAVPEEGQVGDERRLTPIAVTVNNTSGSFDASIGTLRHVFYVVSSLTQGSVEDSGFDVLPVYVRFDGAAANVRQAIQWKRGVVPFWRGI